MSEIKRLLCIVSAMNAGGAETFLMKLYRRLDKEKYQMDFCVSDFKKGFYDDEIQTLGGKVYVIPCKSNSITAFKKSLSDIVKKNHYQYVMRIASNAMGFYDLKVAKQNGTRRCIARSSNSSDGEKLIIKAAHLVGRLLFSRYVDVKLAPSDLAARYTFGKKDYESGNVSILQNAVDLQQYCYLEQNRKQIRKEFEIEENALVIGHIGRFSEQKNHAFLIDVFREIQSTCKNARLLLVGTGERIGQIRSRVQKYRLQDQVIFAGVRGDIPKLLSAMDVLLLPSFYEGMPNAVIEAQATGLQCVVADTITRDANITGLVRYLPLGDAKYWADAAILEAHKKRTDQTKAFLENHYDIDSACQQFVDLIFGDKT